MAEQHSHRRCPQCGTVGRMFRSHSRSKFEKFMHFFSGVVYIYRCHQCNWRGYMFRAFPTQKRFGFWFTIGAMVTIVFVVITTIRLYLRS
ncbi:MAG: hypothetical protein K1X91_17370 [Bacteriodetes bacterium]|nr:hypothetical protein [Bacteroidota bacterium]